MRHIKIFPGFAALLLTSGLARAQAPAGGSYGFLVTSTFNSSAFTPQTFPTAVAFLGVMNFDGAGNVAGPYTYEVDTNTAKVPHTTTGAFTGTVSTNPDGTFAIVMTFDNGLSLTLAAATADGGQSMQLLATNFQFPAAVCGCSVGGIALSGIARPSPGGSLNGSYGYQLHIVPNASTSLGVAQFDGAGNLNLSITFVSPADNTGKAQAPFTFSQAGTYSVNPDGTGTMLLTEVPGVSNAQTYAFVVTDNGAEALLIQLDRSGNGVQAGIGRLQ